MKKVMFTLGLLGLLIISGILDDIAGHSTFQWFIIGAVFSWAVTRLIDLRPRTDEGDNYYSEKLKNSN